MSENEDIGVDLTAWEPPPPAAGLADAVIAKLREPASVAAIEPESPSRWRWFVGGGVAAAAAVVALMFALRGEEPLTGSGAVTVSRPSRIDLGEASSADLEADTDVRWVRDGRRIVAMQPRGTANWRVSPDDKLVIDAGATVASVVATGASLRVEVHPMHVTEARMMVGSAVVSAAVALVTVKVYEGRVEVTGNGTTTAVAPGATVEIRPYTPPVKEPMPVAKAPVLDPDRVGDVVGRKAVERKCVGDVDHDARVDVHLTLGAAGKATQWVVATDPHQRAIVDCFTTAIRESEFGINAGASYALAIAVNPGAYAVVHAERVTDEQVRIANQNHQKDLRDDAKRRFDELERKLQESKDLPAGGPKRLITPDIDKVMAANRASLRKCGDLDAQVVLDIAPSGAVRAVSIRPRDGVSTCVERKLRALKFPANAGGTFEYALKLEPERTVKRDDKPDDKQCSDAVEIEAKADAAQSSGNYAEALMLYKSIVKCRPTVRTKAYLSACRAKAFEDARVFYKVIGKEQFAQICIKEGFDPR